MAQGLVPHMYGEVSKMKNLVAILSLTVGLLSNSVLASPPSGIETVNANILVGHQQLGYNNSTVINNERQKTVIEEALKNDRLKKVFDQLAENVQKQFSKILSTPDAAK